MSVGRSILGWVIPPAIAALAIGLFMSMGSPPPPDRRVAAVAASVSVRSVAVEKVGGRIEIDSDGVVVPIREFTLAAEVPGRVLRRSDACQAGKFVKAGTVLFEIDPRDYELDVARLKGEFNQAVLNIEEIDEELAQNLESTGFSERQVELARRDVKRLEGLKNDRFVTESEHDRSLRDELTSNNAMTTLQGQRRVFIKRRSRLVESQGLAATMLERAELDLSRTRVIAPADGVVVDDKVEQDSFVTKGTPLVTLEDTSAAEVKMSLRMDEVASIWGGRAVGSGTPGGAYDIPSTSASVVYTLGSRSYRWEGLLSRQEGRGLDEKTRTLPCRVLVSDPMAVQAIDRYGDVLANLPPEAPRSLLRGMFVKVRVHVDTPMDLVSIPEDAQRPSGEVWVMRKGTLVILRPHARQVSGGRTLFESAESGLLPDDRVVTSQISNPREGMALAEDSR